MASRSIVRSMRALAIGASTAALAAFGVLATAPTVGASSWYDVCHSGCHYSTIQGAVNAAHNGAVIHIAPGTYHEMVSIQGKHVSLIGAGNSTIIDASGHVNGILIGNPTSGSTTAWTRISCLVVEHAQQAGILAQHTSHLTITNTTVRDNDLATPADAATNQNDNPDYEALHLMSVTDSLVSGNTVVYNKDGGIYLTNEFGKTTGNSVVGNYVANNAVDCGITLASHVAGNAGVSYNLVGWNVSNANGAAGIIIATPVPNGVAAWNRVLDNTVRNNGLGGIDIHGHTTGENLSHNRIEGNHISGNAPDFGATTKPTGISLSGQGGANIASTQIENNSISNETYGIALSGVSNTELEHNWISATTKVYRY